MLAFTEHVAGDLGGGGSIEVRQHARHGVQQVVAGHAPGQRRADHPAEELGDVGFVPGRPERRQHFGARAVPAGRDCVLREQHADVRAILHGFGGDMRDREPSEFDGRVIPEHMRHCVGGKFRPCLPDRLASMVAMNAITISRGT